MSSLAVTGTVLSCCDSGEGHAPTNGGGEGSLLPDTTDAVVTVQPPTTAVHTPTSALHTPPGESAAPPTSPPEDPPEGPPVPPPRRKRKKKDKQPSLENLTEVL